MEDEVVSMQDIFRFVRVGVDGEGRVMGRFAPSGIRPRIFDRLEDHGLEVPPEMAAAFPIATGGAR